MSDLIILGTCGNCIDILDANTRNKCIGFLDDNERLHGKKIWGLPILGSLKDARQYPDAVFVNGIGSPLNFYRKADIIARTKLLDGKFVSIIDVSAHYSPVAFVGEGAVVMHHVTIASGVSIGVHCMILPNSIISHDCKIGDYTTIAGGASISGGVTIGESSYIGANASIIGNVTVGECCLVGMGAVVLEDVPDNTVVVGNPARAIRNTIPVEVGI